MLKSHIIYVELQENPHGSRLRVGRFLLRDISQLRHVFSFLEACGSGLSPGEVQTFGTRPERTSALELYKGDKSRAGYKGWKLLSARTDFQCEEGCS